jgi:hypothetical protein
MGDLGELDVTVHTPHGPLRVSSRSEGNRRQLRVTIPAQVEAELVVPATDASSITLPEQSFSAGADLRAFRLPSGIQNEVWLTQ